MPGTLRGQGDRGGRSARGGRCPRGGRVGTATRRCHPMVGMTNSASARMPVGQRVVMVFSRV